VLYSEFSSTPESLLTIADLGDGGTPVLVINTPTGYRLQRWSAKQKRFE
jgi:hypothetical protein